MVRALVCGLAALAACSYPALPRLCTNDDPSGTACMPAPDGGGSDSGMSSACPSLHLQPQRTTPSIEILIDSSGSMVEMLGNLSRYAALSDALVGASGVVAELQGRVYFGAAVFSSDAPCPHLARAPRALNNEAVIAGLINAQSPHGNTPTPPSIDAVVADFLAQPPPPGSPPIIVLATDGLPNSCDGAMTTEPQSIAAAAHAFASGIRLFVLSVGDTAGTAQHFQDLANAGQGVQPGQPNAPYYPVTTPDQLTMALETIIAGSTGVSCDLKLNEPIDASVVDRGQVMLDGAALVEGVDWTLDSDRVTLHILGAACSMLRATASPVVDASFPCSPG